MNRVLIGLAVVVGVFLVIGLIAFGWIQGTYNRMVVMDEQVNTSWAQVETVLQRRYDLIPNLVETVKGYATHEQEVFIRVTEAHSRVGGATTPESRIEAEGELTQALSRMLLVVENYPLLKANENFIRLMDELAGTENRISVERQRYNESVQTYNQYIRQFPQNILAGMFSFERRPFFEAPVEAEQAPRVNFP